MMNDDMALVREFAASGSERAFAMLVERHLPLVYSAAMRRTGDPQIAEEIAQAVFIILARKAKALSDKTILSGWLYRTAQFAASDALKIQRRREQREQEAFMRSTLEDSRTETAWLELSPLLDEAMLRLRPADRDVLVLRFFENKSLSEVGGALGLHERAAQKRIVRALEKLRAFFLKRGVSSTAAIIAGAISANSVQAAPIGLTKTITVVAATKGATASASTLTLIKGALKVMAWTKIKSVVVVAGAIILAAGTTGLVVEHQLQEKRPIPQSAWALKGGATPEAAFQSALWAMSKGDAKTFLEYLTPEYRKTWTESAAKAKSEAALAEAISTHAAMIGAFQIIRVETVSTDEVILHVNSVRMGNGRVPLKQIQGEWRINGNLMSEGPAKRL